MDKKLGMDNRLVPSLKAPIGQIAVALVIVGLVGAYGGGWLFEQVFKVPATSFVRESLAVSLASFFAFVLSLVRILRGEKPIDVHVPASWNLWLSALLVMVIGYLVGTTVFR